MDIQELITRQEALVAQAQAIREQAEKVQVVDKETCEKAVDFLGKIATAKKALDERRQSYVRPLNDEVKLINEAFKGITEPVLKADAMVRQKVSAYQVEQQRKAAEEQRKALEAARQVAQETGEILPVVMAEAPEKVVRTEAGNAYTRLVWDFKVVDETRVPEQYKVVEEKLIRAAVASGLRAIPGVEIFQRSELTVRGK